MDPSLAQAYDRAAVYFWKNEHDGAIADSFAAIQLDRTDFTSQSGRQGDRKLWDV